MVNDTEEIKLPIEEIIRLIAKRIHEGPEPRLIKCGDRWELSCKGETTIFSPGLEINEILNKNIRTSEEIEKVIGKLFGSIGIQIWRNERE